MSYDLITPENSHIELPDTSSVRLDIVSLESGGLPVPKDQWQDFLDIAPSESPYMTAGAKFSLLSHERLMSVVLRATIMIPLPDGTLYSSVSDPITLRVSDESIDIDARIDGVSKTKIDTTFSSPVILNLKTINASGAMIDANLPYTLDIYDAYDDTLIESGIIIANSTYTLSYTYSKKIGTYRFVIRDRLGRTGESTLTVTSGPLARATITPVSSALVMGADSLGVIRLLDALGNVLTPELHSIDITAA